MLSALKNALVALMALTAVENVTARDMAARRQAVHARQAEAAKRWRGPVPRADAASGGAGTVKNITFTNPRASDFYVDGAAIPNVTWDVGPSWAGLLPISSDPNETRQLYFWFFPPGPQGSLDDLVFWTNGGPGCSSLEGQLEENGPFLWQYGQAYPTPNEYSWTNLSSLLYVEQPVGTGFSLGQPNITDENDLAAQLVGFFGQFLDVFSELKGKNFYLSGESYAGMYVPYIANYIYENPDLLDLSLKGFWISDPSISWDVILEEVPAVSFVNRWAEVFSFNSSFMEYLNQQADDCGYTQYLQEYLTYPPKGLLPLPGDGNVEFDPGCDVWDEIFSAALVINPAFNIYHILDTPPLLWDVLGFPGSFEDIQTPVYYNREDVKKAINAPLDVEWTECSNVNVFPYGDNSLPSALTVLPNAIEKSERSVIVHGLADFILLSEGTRIAIQNMTWNGLQGFRTPIENETFIVDGVGAMGNMHSERGLTYFEVDLSGHMIPQYQPAAAFQIMQYLLGFREQP